ncbi:hypothetical protein RF11_03397 [Thelohanellus kitauei]|uniref:Uncharacterized protein n=1 Tax=Thelohanellus kitauei TaxID=669202 RepID=A0A0C2MSW7_THEKT|nr:hypothetical protein RF11_03397 [Thelohanellus kitauei]
MISYKFKIEVKLASFVALLAYSYSTTFFGQMVRRKTFYAELKPLIPSSESMIVKRERQYLVVQRNRGSKGRVRPIDNTLDEDKITILVLKGWPEACMFASLKVRESSIAMAAFIPATSDFHFIDSAFFEIDFGSQVWWGNAN